MVFVVLMLSVVWQRDNHSVLVHQDTSAILKYYVNKVMRNASVILVDPTQSAENYLLVTNVHANQAVMEIRTMVVNVTVII